MLLKSTLDALHTKNTNLIAGFSACGINPIDRNRLLKILPDYSDPNFESSTNSWSSSIVDVLDEATRCPEQRSATRARGKKINIEPGKSVGAEDDETSIGSLDRISSSSTSMENESSSTDSTNSKLSSTESIENNCHQSQSTDILNSLPNSSLDNNREYQINFIVGEFIVARFKSSCRSLLYTGKIIKVNANEKTFK